MDVEFALEAAVMFAVAAAILVSGAIVWLLYRTGSLPHPAPVVTSLTILSLIAIVAGALTGNEAFVALAGTGVEWRQRLPEDRFLP